ncbi:unnamed protein product [Sphagnum tenellum]
MGDLGGSDEVKTAKFSSGDLREAKVRKGAAGALQPEGLLGSKDLCLQPKGLLRAMRLPSLPRAKRDYEPTASTASVTAPPTSEVRLRANGEHRERVSFTHERSESERVASNASVTVR